MVEEEEEEEDWCKHKRVIKKGKNIKCLDCGIEGELCSCDICSVKGFFADSETFFSKGNILRYKNEEYHPIIVGESGTQYCRACWRTNGFIKIK